MADQSGADAPPMPPSRLLSQKEVAEMAGVDARTVRRWVASGLLRQITPQGSRIARYRLSDVTAFFGEPLE